MIIRTKHNKNNPYAQINKKALEDGRLSFKSVGLLAYLLSRPDNWKTHINQLISSHQDGEHSVRSAITELIKLGYIKRVRVTDKRGRVRKWELIVRESPDVDFPDVDFPDVDFPDVENQVDNNIDSTKTEKNKTEKKKKTPVATTEKAEEEVFFAPDRREDPGKQETPSLLAEENRDEDPGSEPETRVDPEIPAPKEEKAPPSPPQYMDTPKEDIRFDKKIPFSGDLNSACYRQEMRFFNPQLPDLSEGAVHTLQTTEGKTLLCLLNEKGLDPIARIEGFLRFYFDQNLADNSNYKGKPYDGLTQAKVATAIASKIRYNDTGVLIQTISEFKKRIEGPRREFIKILDEKPEETPELIAAKEKGMALIRAKIEQNRAKTPLKKAKTPLNEETIMLTLLPAQNANKTAIGDQPVENLSTFVS